MEQQLCGLVVKEQSGFYWVEVQDGTVYRCQLRGKLKEEAQLSDIAAIGDRVEITLIEEEGTDVLIGAIQEVTERESVLSRAVRTTGKRGAGQAEREHVLIANAQQAFFVFSATKPTPNFKLLDCLLVTGEKSNIPDLVIVVNKIDLEDPSTVDSLFAPYIRMGYEVIQTSAITGDGIAKLRERLKDKISVFTGPSGVGKTSLLNLIQPDLGRVVKSVGSTDEGQHTTRDSALIKLEAGGYLADTPGVRQLFIWDVEPDELDGYFVDISEHVEQCRFNNCSHINEPGCAVLKAVKDGHVARHRYKHYLEIREELRDTYIVY